MLEVLYHHAKFGGARISPATGAAKNVEFFCCPDCKPEAPLFSAEFVCLCVCDRHFYPLTLTDFDETWSQGPYCDLVLYVYLTRELCLNSWTGSRCRFVMHGGWPWPIQCHIVLDGDPTCIPRPPGKGQFRRGRSGPL